VASDREPVMVVASEDRVETLPREKPTFRVVVVVNLNILVRVTYLTVYV